MSSDKTYVLQRDLEMDLEQIISEAADSGRLFGADEVTIEETQIEDGVVKVFLSNHQCVALRVEILS